MAPELNQQLRQVRLVFIFLIGIVTTYQIWESRYEDGWLTDITWVLPLLIFAPLFIYSIVVEDKRFRASKNWSSLLGTLMGLVFVPAMLTANWLANRDYYKPTLLKACYDGDMNGLELDFKTDGTYVFNEWCFGSQYTYGTYTINGNHITLDRDELGNISRIKHLEIGNDPWQNTHLKSGWYLLYSDTTNRRFDFTPEFRITVDNRKKH